MHGIDQQILAYQILLCFYQNSEETYHFLWGLVLGLYGAGQVEHMVLPLVGQHGAQGVLGVYPLLNGLLLSQAVGGVLILLDLLKHIRYLPPGREREGKGTEVRKREGGSEEGEGGRKGG